MVRVGDSGQGMTLEVDVEQLLDRPAHQGIAVEVDDALDRIGQQAVEKQAAVDDAGKARAGR